MKSINECELISEKYKKVLQAKFRKIPKWGGTGFRNAAWVIEELVNVNSILDYGCGNGSLFIKLGQMGALKGILTYQYDPGRDIELPADFQQADVVTCFDVMEHVEEDKVDAVLDDICAKCNKVALFTISMIPSVHKLPDGRNAHITIHKTKWWKERLYRVFTKVEVVRKHNTLLICRCEP